MALTPLLLLHGFTGGPASFEPLCPFLENHFNITRLTLPGHGAAPPAQGTFEQVVDSLAHGIPQPTIVHGYSMGARLALALALRHPTRVLALSLESGSPGLPTEREREVRRGDDEELAERILSHGLEAFMAQWERQPLFASLVRLPEALKAHIAQLRRSHSAAGLASVLRQLGLGSQPSYWDRLGRLGMPVQLITGAEDQKFTTTAQRMAALIPGARHVVIHDCGHAPHLEHPAQLAQLIINHTGGRHEVQLDQSPRI